MTQTLMDNDRSGEPRSELESMRLQWHTIRDHRLALKAELLASGLDKTAVRKHREYRRFRKEQDRLSTLMRHIEKRLNKQRAKSQKKETGP